LNSLSSCLHFLSAAMPVLYLEFLWFKISWMCFNKL
jgi:hypothetical protein